MDVVAVRADELEPDGSDEEAQSRRGATVATAVVLVVFVALAAAVAMLLVRAHDRAARDDVRDAVLQAARQEAVNLTTLSYKTAQRDIYRLLSGATGELHDRFSKVGPAEVRQLTTTRSTSRGTVLSAGLVRLAPAADAAQVVVATDATVTTQSGSGSSPESVLKHYRMVMRLEKVGSRWLVSDVAFAGRAL